MATPASAGYFLSPQQKALWLAQAAGENHGYSSQVAVLLEGQLEAERVRSALREVVARHDILRTVFYRQAGMKVPFQMILEQLDPAWEFCERTGTDPAEYGSISEQMLEAQGRGAWDFDRGPLLRAALMKVAEQRYILAVTIASLCADRQSLRNILAELVRSCAGAKENLAEALRYVQFAQWQSEMLEADDAAAQEGKKFWSEVANNEPLKLLSDSGQEVSTGVQRLAIEVDAAIQTGVEQSAKRLNVGPAEILLAAWQILLSRMTGQKRFAIGIIFAGREYEELEAAIGPIAKTLPVEARFDGELCFREVVLHVKAGLAAAAGWQEYFDPANSLESGAEIAFEYSSLPAEESVGEVRFRILREYADTAHCKLRLQCQLGESGLGVELEYEGGRYGREGMEQMGRHFGVLLRSAVGDVESVVGRLPLLEEAERRRMVEEWNRTEREYPGVGRSMGELIEEQVKRVPERAAVRCGEVVLSYEELNRRANQLGRYLRKLGVGPDGLVGLCLERSVEMMVAVLGIWKAGGAYVPLNADNPKPRLQQQLSGVKVLLTERSLVGKMPEFAGVVLKLDADEDRAKWEGEPEENPEAVGSGEDLAYVIYTSGSTGVPKGVGVRQRNLANYASYVVHDLLRLERYEEGLQFATVSTLGADLGNTCIYPGLMSGGCVHVIPYEVATDGVEMGRYQERYGIDVLKIVPSHLGALLEGAEGKKVLPRKYLILGGEGLRRGLVEKIAESGAGCEVINHYGPTETTVGSLVQRLGEWGWKGSRSGSIPIGKPIGNTQAYVLDGELEVVAEGVSGELYIGGAGVAAGYVGQEGQTGERFVGNPFKPGTVLYRTGDVVRYVVGGGGAIEYVGRADEQVKVRGFRVELGEIEAGLLRQGGVKQAVVVAQEAEGDQGQNQEQRLVGYVVVDRRSGVEGEGIRKGLAEELPEYMVPAVVVLEKLPLNANGKVDRKGLPKAEAQAGEKVYEAPRSGTEEMVGQIWGEVLKLERVGRADDFFALGGHSLLATQVVSRIRERLQVEIALRTLFEAPVLHHFAAKIETAKQKGVIADGPIRRVSRDAYRAVKTGG